MGMYRLPTLHISTQYAVRLNINRLQSFSHFHFELTFACFDAIYLSHEVWRKAEANSKSSKFEPAQISQRYPRLTLNTRLFFHLT